MTPFGEKMRALRAERGLQLKDMAAGLGVSSAYLSALEHGRRGRRVEAAQGRAGVDLHPRADAEQLDGVGAAVPPSTPGAITSTLSGPRGSQVGSHS